MFATSSLVVKFNICSGTMAQKNSKNILSEKLHPDYRDGLNSL
jgi:hypothetical protein